MAETNKECEICYSLFDTTEECTWNQVVARMNLRLFRMKKYNNPGVPIMQRELDELLIDKKAEGHNIQDEG